MLTVVNPALRHILFCSSFALLIALNFMDVHGQSTTSSQRNLFRLERNGTGWQLRFTLADTTGTYRIVRSDQLETLGRSSSVLAIVGAAGSARTGVIDVARLSGFQSFFGLVGDQSIVSVVPFTPPPGMLRIPAGTFLMGSPTKEKERSTDETQRLVTLTKDFYMNMYEVTQKDYLRVMGSNPSFWRTNDPAGKPVSPDLSRPVESVTWSDATNYCAKLTASEKAVGRLPAGWLYRLPTEAEWEYACRAGTDTPFHYGNDLRSGMANFVGIYDYVGGTRVNPNGIYLAWTTHVGSYAPNAFGLYDMHGNVYEWCLDWYGGYASGSATDPKGPSSGSYRVVRGGGWLDYARFCRSAGRRSGEPGRRYNAFGFRPVLASSQ